MTFCNFGFAQFDDNFCTESLPAPSRTAKVLIQLPLPTKLETSSVHTDQTFVPSALRFGPV